MNRVAIFESDSPPSAPVVVAPLEHIMPAIQALQERLYFGYRWFF
jgi:hypothetical protein